MASLSLLQLTSEHTSTTTQATQTDPDSSENTHVKELAISSSSGPFCGNAGMADGSPLFHPHASSTANSPVSNSSVTNSPTGGCMSRQTRPDGCLSQQVCAEDTASNRAACAVPPAASNSTACAVPPAASNSTACAVPPAASNSAAWAVLPAASNSTAWAVPPAASNSVVCAVPPTASNSQMESGSAAKSVYYQNCTFQMQSSTNTHNNNIKNLNEMNFGIENTTHVEAQAGVQAVGKPDDATQLSLGQQRQLSLGQQRLAAPQQRKAKSQIIWTTFFQFHGTISLEFSAGHS